jgi:signal transduction histidine kinase/CheY-like chemotaxis protein
MKHLFSQGSKASHIVVIGTNVALISLLIVSFVSYTVHYNNKSVKQNENDISNINVSSSRISSALLANQYQRLIDSKAYITAESVKLNYEQTLDFIYNNNGDRQNTRFELVNTSGNGYADVKTATGTYTAVSYSSGAYPELNRILSSTERAASELVLATNEFTDAVNGLKSFAVYTYISIPTKNTSGDYVAADYTLMAVFKSSNFSSLIQSTANYTDIGTVLLNIDGDYVFGSLDFKETNLFRYIADYNDLSASERDVLRDDFSNHFTGETTKAADYTMEYKNSDGKMSHFVAASVSKTNWICMTAVPLSSYANSNPNFYFLSAILLVLATLMVFNILWMRNLNKHLRISAEKEKEANAAKTDFLSRMSHDIRTPLNVITGSVLLAEREDNNEKTTKYLSNIDQSSHFLLSLVNDILDLNKVSAGKMELHLAPYTLDQLQAAMTAIIGPLCQEKNLTLSIEMEKTKEAYMLDEVRIKQIFFNILSNSVKFTNPGGLVTLKGTVKVIDDDKATLSFVATDNGKGMSKEFQTKMFDPFTQEETGRTNTQQGTGLGLSIVRNLVTVMGGMVKVDSDVGKGTTFYIDIPANRVQNVPDKKKETSIQLDILKGKKVLVAEDNAINVSILKTLLEDKGMIVDVATNGDEAVKMFVSKEANTYDIILMDMRMPVMDGLTATKEIRDSKKEDSKTIPIVAMTANAYDEDLKACLDAGMNGFVAKPIDPDLMYSTMAQEIQKDPE